MRRTQKLGRQAADRERELRFGGEFGVRYLWPGSADRAMRLDGSLVVLLVILWMPGTRGGLRVSIG
jgi:hypothetical protein